eukprot:11810320-Heterocapsa_arctica.AAC.1
MADQRIHAISCTEKRELVEMSANVSIHVANVVVDEDHVEQLLQNLSRVASATDSLHQWDDHQL